MERECLRAQEGLVEAAGDLLRLSEAERDHLSACASCMEVAAAEQGLAKLFEQAVPPADPEVVERTLKALVRARRRQRILALAPVAASIMMVAAGAALLGGVPGGSVLALFPLWSSQGWLAVLGAVSDWQIAATAAARAVPSMIPPMVQVAALMLSLCGVAGIVLSVRRWRKSLSWRREL